MATTNERTSLSPSLEDYLETIFELVRDRDVARATDIAKARGVPLESIEPALDQLAERGLVEHTKHRGIDLTPEGEKVARRVYARHQVLARFFQEILGTPEQTAQADACAMEHSLSDEGMDHLVRFLEFMQLCPDARDFLRQFRECAWLAGNPEQQRGRRRERTRRRRRRRREMTSLADLRAGQSGRVALVDGAGAVRQRLLDMGILPNVELEVQRVAPAGGPVWIKLEGSQLTLRRNEARAVLLEG